MLNFGENMIINNEHLLIDMINKITLSLKDKMI